MFSLSLGLYYVSILLRCFIIFMMRSAGSMLTLYIVVFPCSLGRTKESTCSLRFCKLLFRYVVVSLLLSLYWDEFGLDRREHMLIVFLYNVVQTIYRDCLQRPAVVLWLFMHHQHYQKYTMQNSTGHIYPYKSDVTLQYFLVK